MVYIFYEKHVNEGWVSLMYYHDVLQSSV